MLGRRRGGGSSLVSGIKKGAGIGLGLNLVNSLTGANQAQQNNNQQQQQQGWWCGCGKNGNTGRFCSECGNQQGASQQAPQAPAPQQNAAPVAAAASGFLDRLAGSAEKMMDATTDHIKNASVGECEFCGSKISQGEKTCASCGGTF